MDELLAETKLLIVGIGRRECLYYLLVEHGQPVDVAEPVVILDVVDAVDEIAVASCEVFLYHVIEQIAQVAREELGKLELHRQSKRSADCHYAEESTMVC